MSVTTVTATSISLSWSVPSGSVVTSSEVMWREASSGTSEGTSGSLTDTSYTIDQLESTTIYTITVTVSNTAGTTDSQPVIISTSNSHYIMMTYISVSFIEAEHFIYPYIICTSVYHLHIQILIVVREPLTVIRLRPLTVHVQRQTILQLSSVV